MSLREEPVVRGARLQDGRAVTLRVVVPDDPYLPRPELDTVVVELAHADSVLAVVATPLSASDVERAHALADRIRAGLESGAFPPTADGIERLAAAAPP